MRAWLFQESMPCVLCKMHGTIAHIFPQDIQARNTRICSFANPVHLNFGLKPLISRLFPTTLTELKAIAAPAITGLSKKPLNG